MVVILDEDATLATFQSHLLKNPLSAVVAVASTSPKCQLLIENLKQLSGETQGGCCGGSPYEIIILSTDTSDTIEDLALDLGLDGIPSFQVYMNGKLQPGFTNVDTRTITAEMIQKALDQASQNSSSLPPSTSNGASDGCCPPQSNDVPDGCCPPPSNGAVSCCPNPNENQPTDAAEILKLVQQSYANTVNKSAEGCCVSVDPNLNAYDMDELLRAGAKEANLGLGCGNPISFANVKNGETVVDLGSGAGIDCFLASVKVGATGKVIGVDMTPDMLSTARNNAKKRLCAKDNDIYDNVTFRLGEIEHLPIADNTADVVISNCVINLSPDKQQVYREIHRVLKPGGRIAITDVVNRPDVEIPDHLKTAEALAC